MRILQTSDWHLGKSIHGQDLLPDQKKLLDDLKNELISNDHDALLIAGDIYDRSIPPTEAVELFSDFIESMVENKIITIVIPGNHDSSSRLDFASGVLEMSGIYFRCRYDRITEPIIVQDREGNSVQVFALPFVDEVVVKAEFPGNDIRTHQDATAFLVDMIRGSKDPSIPSILVAHTYTGREPLRSDSERELLVGNQGLVDIEVFHGFDHVALGHLHRSQVPSRTNNIQYSGSLMTYSFSEAGQEKSSNVLELDGDVIVSRDMVHKMPRKFSVIEGEMNDLLMDTRYEGYRDHYLSVKIIDKALLVDIHRRLLERFAHILEIDQPALHVDAAGPDHITREDADDPSKLFSLFLDRFGWAEGKERDLACSIFYDIRKDIERKEVRS